MLESVRELFRFRIRATDGKVGKVDDFYFEDPTWAIRCVVVNTGRWLPSNRVLIQPSRIGSPDPAARVIPVAMTKDEVMHCAGSETEEPVSHQQERLLQERFGSSLYVRGGGPMGPMHGVAQGQALALAEGGQGKPGEPEVKSTPRLRSAREVIGYKMEAVDGPIGVLEDFLIDDDEWVIPYMVVNTKDVRLPNPKVLAPLSWIQYISWSESRIHLRVHRDKVKHSQRYDPLSHSPLQKPKPFIWP